MTLSCSECGGKLNCVYCDEPIGGGVDGYYSLVTDHEVCSKSITGFHEAEEHVIPPIGFK